MKLKNIDLTVLFKTFRTTRIKGIPIFKFEELFFFKLIFGDPQFRGVLAKQS